MNSNVKKNSGKSSGEAINEKALARRIKEHVIGRPHHFFAILAPGFEDTAADELLELGVREPIIRTTGGLEFKGRLNDLYRLNLCSGTVNRFLMRLFSFRTTSAGIFEKKTAGFPWELYLSGGMNMAFSFTISQSRLHHENMLREILRRSIEERLKGYGRSVIFLSRDMASSREETVQTLFLRACKDRFQFSLDSSGERLYLRGHGRRTETAPIRETLAHAILRTAAIGRYRLIIDPFAGSGTFSQEAALILSRRPPGSNHSFAFQKWPAFRSPSFAYLKKQLQAAEASPGDAQPAVHCSDISQKSVDTCAANLQTMNLSDRVKLRKRDFFSIEAPPLPGEEILLVMNPPYGIRMGSAAETERLYRRIGEKVRRDFRGCGYAVIIPSLELEKILALPYDRKILFQTGGRRVSLLVKYAFPAPAKRSETEEQFKPEPIGGSGGVEIETAGAKMLPEEVT